MKGAAALVRLLAVALLAGGLACVMIRFSPGYGLDENQLDPRLSSASQDAIRRSHDGIGSLGFSVSLNRPVRELLAERCGPTAVLMLWGLAGAWLLAAVLAAPPLALRMPWLGAAANALGGIPAALPAAGIAVALFRLGASPRWMIALALVPRLYQYLRGLLVKAYSSPHVLMARGKGLGPGRVLWSHVLRPARGQIFALAAVSVNMAIGAAVAVEAVCDLPGLGQLAWKAALARDLPVLVALTILIALVTQAANFAADQAAPAEAAAPAFGGER